MSMWEDIDVARLRRALHRWKTEQAGDPTPHTEWWASRCDDCYDDAKAIADAYMADLASDGPPEPAMEAAIATWEQIPRYLRDRAGRPTGS